MADILPINTWFCFDFVSSVHRVPFNNVQLQVYIIKIKIVLYTQLSQLSHISLELSKHNIINMCVILCTSEKSVFFTLFPKKNALLEKHHFYLSDMRNQRSLISVFQIWFNVYLLTSYMTRFDLWIFMSKSTHDFWLCRTRDRDEKATRRNGSGSV
jgi:hypothetical protein